MTKDEIIRIAQEAGFVVDEKAQQHQPNCIFHTHHMVDELLERFAAAVCESLAAEAEKNGNSILAMQLRARGQA